MLAARGFDMETPDRIESGVEPAGQTAAQHPAGRDDLHGTLHRTAGRAATTDEGFQAKADAELITLWQWHALEELEHKSVAYDVYRPLATARPNAPWRCCHHWSCWCPCLASPGAGWCTKDGQFWPPEGQRDRVELAVRPPGLRPHILPACPSSRAK